MSSKLNIKKNVVTTVTAFLINILLTFIGYKLLINQGGLEALGVWSILSAAIFVMRIGDIGMGGATERYIAMTTVEEKGIKIRQYFDTALAINTILFIVLAIIGWLIFSKNIEWIVPKDSELQSEALNLLPLMLLVFIISNIANVFNAGLRGLHIGYKSAYLSIASNIVQMSLVIFLVPKIGLAGLAWGQLVQNLLVIAIAWFLIYKNIKKYVYISWIPIYVSKQAFKELFSFSLKAQAVSLVNGLFEPVSKFLVGHTAGLTMLGLFELAYKIVSLPRNAIVSGALGIIPAIAKLLDTNINEAKKLYLKSRKLVVFLATTVLICVVIMSPIISWILFEKIDWILIYIIIILVIGFVGNIIGASAYTLGFSSGKLKGNLISSMVALIILFLGIFLAKYFEFYGMIVASAVGLFVAGIIIKKINEKILF